MACLTQYLTNLLVILTQTLNTLLGGSPDESTSSRAYRLKDRKGWDYLYRFINWLFNDTDHCFRAYLVEKERLASWERHKKKVKW